LLDGQEIVGASGDVTMIFCVQVANRAFGSLQSGGLLHSVAVQVIVVVPIGYPSLNDLLSLRTPVTTTLLPVALGGLTVTEASFELPEVVAV
jgi:hypothetical protein